MGVFPGFGAWMDQNNQQPLNTKSNRSHDVESNLVSKKDTNELLNEECDEYETRKQEQLWHEAEKKHPWYDAPPKVKVTKKNGICHMLIEFTVGIPPMNVFFHLTDRSSYSSPFFDDVKWRKLLASKSSKILKDDGPRQIAKLEKRLTWDFLWWSGTLPIHLIVDENRKEFSTKYKKEKMIFMKVFEGSYKVEPIYVDQERLCKHMLPKSQEEYRKCRGGQGKVASKGTMDQYFQPYLPLNLPPFSWYIQKKTIKTTKTLLESIQKLCANLRSIPPVTKKT